MTRIEPREGVRLGRALALALWFAIGTATVQVAVVATRHYVLGEFTWVTRDFVWMSPIAYAPFFLLIGGGAWVLGRAWRAASTARAQLFAMTFFAASCLLLLLPQLWGPARMILALGVAIQLSHVLAARFDRWWRTMRLGGVACAGALSAVGLASHVLAVHREAQWLATTPPPAGDAPNVLIVILDTVRAMSMGLYGAPRSNTPTLEALARQGALFEHAHAAAPWTLPSHASLLTGRYPHELSANYLVPLDGSAPMLGEILERHGYATGAVVANLHYAGWESGLGRGFLHFDDSDVSLRQVLMNALVLQTDLARGVLQGVRHRSPVEVLRALAHWQWSSDSRYLGYARRSAPTVNNRFLSWVDGLHGRPFMALLNYFDAHAPYRPGMTFAGTYDSSGVHRDVDAYEESIAFLDGQLGALFQSLRDRGLLDNTIVVVASDHGEQFGGHGLWDHGNSVYPQVAWIPLILRYPARVPPGVRVRTAVSLCDVSATVLELLGAHDTLGHCPSMMPIVAGERATRAEPVIVERALQPRLPGQYANYERAIVNDSLYYVRRWNGDDELYRSRRDPRALHDLWAELGHSADVAHLRIRAAQLAQAR